MRRARNCGAGCTSAESGSARWRFQPGRPVVACIPVVGLLGSGARADTWTPMTVSASSSVRIPAGCRGRRSYSRGACVACLSHDGARGAARRLAESTAMFLFRSGGGWMGGDVGGSHPRGGVSSATISRSGPGPGSTGSMRVRKPLSGFRTAAQINVERTVVARPCGGVVAAHQSQRAKVEPTPACAKS
jgi:hypothetical protein